MGNSLVKSQLEEVSSFLGTTVNALEEYLNAATQESLQREQSADEGGFPSDIPFHNPIASETSEHELTLLANTAVTFTHNLNKFPSVAFINSNGDMVLADVHYNSRNSITIRFNADFTGLMVLN